ncbi:mucolipin-1 [Trichinella spiralis]|uniref:mucolipin-1 n=1 Tax=Trichinella spiralis TaxID=6334 RepID=UPI0001EFD79E|nr:mucolipin-1 [Trichinella spiralis]
MYQHTIRELLSNANIVVEQNHHCFTNGAASMNKVVFCFAFFLLFKPKPGWKFSSRLAGLKTRWANLPWPYSGNIVNVVQWYDDKNQTLVSWSYMYTYVPTAKKSQTPISIPKAVEIFIVQSR